MYFFHHFLAILPLFALASADCKNEGDESNDDERTAIGSDAVMSPICTALQGNYIRGEYRYNCVTIGRGKFIFQLTNQANSDRSVSLADCMKWAKNESIGCHKRGETNYGDFRMM